MKIRDIIVEADPAELGPMNPKMKAVLGKVHTGDVKQAQADAETKAKAKADQRAEAARLRKEDPEMLQQYIDMLKKHDWTYEYSDGYSRAYVKGQEEHYDIMNMAKKIDPDLEIYNKYDPLKKEGLGEATIDESKMSFQDMSKNREFAYTFRQYVKGNANKDQVAELVRGRVDSEQFADEVFKQGVRMGGAKGDRIKELADYIRKDSNVFDLPGKALDRIKKFAGIGEAATAGATSSANVASGTPVAAHSVGKSYTGSPGKSGTKAPKQAKVNQPKKKDGTAKNALDMNVGLMSGQGAIKR